MKAVLVVDENLNSFAPALEAASCGTGDICFGAVDDRTDTACGVMSTEVIPGRILSVSYIYVHPDYRRRGAARAMLSLLLEFAVSNGIASLQCRHEADNESDDVTDFFDRMGFSRDEKDTPLLYTIRVKDLKKTRSPGFKGRVETVRNLTYRAWTQYEGMLEMSFPWRSELDEDLSFIASDENLSPSGVLFTGREKKGLKILVFGVTGDQPSDTAEALFEHAIDAARAGLPEDEAIIAEINDENEAHDLFRLTGNRAQPAGQVICMKYKVEDLNV